MHGTGNGGGQSRIRRRRPEALERGLSGRPRRSLLAVPRRDLLPRALHHALDLDRLAVRLLALFGGDHERDQLDRLVRGHRRLAGAEERPDLAHQALVVAAAALGLALVPGDGRLVGLGGGEGADAAVLPDAADDVALPRHRDRLAAVYRSLERGRGAASGGGTTAGMRDGLRVWSTQASISPWHSTSVVSCDAPPLARSGDDAAPVARRPCAAENTG